MSKFYWQRVYSSSNFCPTPPEIARTLAEPLGRSRKAKRKGIVKIRREPRLPYKKRKQKVNFSSSKKKKD